MFIVKYKKIFIGLSSVFVLASFFIILFVGLKTGIDFKGGALTEISYLQKGENIEIKPEISVLQDKLNALNIGNVLIQPGDENNFLIKTRDLSEAERIQLFDAFSLDNKYSVEEKSFTSIGPSVGKELRKKAFLSITLVIFSMIVFIAYAFRNISEYKQKSGKEMRVSSWKYGLVAIITLIHDVTIPSAFFALFGHYLGAEVDMLFVVALLTILGLSINDTIVIFDRIRENLKNKISDNFADTVGISIKQTMGRSINTSITIIFALLALFFFGPVSTKYFALMLTIGMFFGTYSSIFLASPLLVLAEELQHKK